MKQKCNILLGRYLSFNTLASQEFLMSTSAAEQRRLAALEAFRAELDMLDSEEIRRRLDIKRIRLDIKRIRSEEKRAIAEDVLRRREEDAIARSQPPPVQPAPGAGALVTPPSHAKGALQPSSSQPANHWLNRVLRLIRSLAGFALLFWGLRR
jgi:hypothetical protein